jgi:hypothetical protein
MSRETGGSTHRCVICRHEFIGFGHNAEPVKHGRCCNVCNDLHVIPARIRAMRAARDKERDTQ